MQLLDYIVLLGYLTLSIGLGVCASGKQKDLKTFLLADHQMHWMLIAISILSGLFSGISFLGTPSEVYNHNLIYLWVILAYFIATPITTKIFLPFFYRLNFYTAYEYLEHRFDLRLRRLSSAVFIFRVTLWLALAQFAPALVISEMMGISIVLAIAITGICTMIYTILGGMKAVIYTDVMQFVVLFAGIVIVLIVATAKTPGGLEGAWKIAESGGRTQFWDWSFSFETRMTIFGAFIGGVFTNLVQLVTDQMSVQRYLTAKSLKESQRSLWVKLWITAPLLSVFFLTGLVLYAYYQSHPDILATLNGSDRLLPNFVMHEIFSPVPGLLVAAILAATMSTVSAGINSLTTATLMDFVYTERGNFVSKQEEKRRVRIARIWTFIYASTTALIALIIDRLGTLIEASNKIAGLLGGPLLGIFFLGVFSRRANAQGTLIGVIIGFIAVVSTGLFTQTSFMWYALIGCGSTYLFGEIASRFYSEPTEKQTEYSLHARREEDI